MGWQEVADAVVNRRVELGMRHRKQLAEATGITVKTLGELERADRTTFDRSTLAAVEQALEWKPGTIASVAADRPARTERLSRDPGTFAMLDAGGREIIPELVDLIHFMSPDSNLDKEGREAARKILYGVVMTLAQLSAQTNEVRRLTGVPEPDFDPGDLGVPDQGDVPPAEVVQPRVARQDPVRR